MSSDRKVQLWFVAIFLVVMAGVVALAAFASKGAPLQAAPATSVPALSATDHVRGKADAAVSVIEYGDFQCPACAAYESVMRQLTQEYGDRVAFSFRNFPLTQIHANALSSCEAAEAGGMQGAYWKMYGLLYAKQNDWSKASPASVAENFYVGYAQSLGIDAGKFRADMGSAAVRDKIRADIASANAARVDHTPTFFVNLKQIPNPKSYEDFKVIIDAALAEEADAASAE